MEPKLPKLQNLAGHVGECKGVKDAVKKDEPTSEEQMNLARSAKLMEAFLKEGELNPAVTTTYKGFLRIFAAWIFDESLPWTTGEAPTLPMLFKYLKITYRLPSDTTVRNQLAHIFNELHGKVVHEFAVSVMIKFELCPPHWDFRRSNRRLHMQQIRGRHLRWCIRLHARLRASSMTIGI
jgi:hypothetical protein